MLTHVKSLASRIRLPVFLKEMNSWSFVQQLNPINNKMEWKVVDDDYDYNQEIATSCYGDMLHDDERNKKFGDALKKAINKLHSSGKKAHVLDIGTGTGLLSMLAVRYGADSVVACEAFHPMANCAISIINENNFSDKIKIVKSHSTSLTVGENGDLKQRANILVSEVFDTELIGEGAIKTFNHALENLIMPDCIVIPSSGTVYAQIVESRLASKWNRLEDWKSGDDVLVKITDEIKNCPGAAAVHDIQLSEFDRKDFKVLSEVLPVFRFDWAKDDKIPTYRQTKSVFKAINSGKAQVVFMWWDLVMDQDGEIILSCAPIWEHPDTKGEVTNKNIKTLTRSLPWRDHWMQAVYFLTDETILTKNQEFALISNHDEFSFWFQMENNSKLEKHKPVCDCAFHFLLSRTRVGAINDDTRRDCYLKTLRSQIRSNTVCIVLSDITLLAILSAKLGAKKVYILNEDSYVDKVCRMLSDENSTNDVLSFRSNTEQIIKSIKTELENETFDVLILSEPYFRNSILPWDNLSIWYMKQDIEAEIKNLSQVRSIRTVPTKCKLRCCAMQFDNLWKIATPLNSCEGFSLKIFDDLIGAAKDKAENYIEAQPLWEYPGIALTLPCTIFEFDLNEALPKKVVKSNGELEFGCFGRCDGVALWMEYQFPDDCSISFGPVEEVVINNYISWDMFERQGVHLFRNQQNVNSGDFIQFQADFDPEEAEFTFDFHFGESK